MENRASAFRVGLGRKPARRPLLRSVLAASVFLAAVYTAPAPAGEWSLLVNGKAMHINAPDRAKLNEHNWGAGFQYDFDIVDGKWVPFVTASGFNDSNRNPSYYVGGGIVRRYPFTAWQTDYHLDLGLVGFVMTRKDYKDGDPFLGALPALSFGTERVALNVTYVPKVHPKLVRLVFFQVKISFRHFQQ